MKDRTSRNVSVAKPSRFRVNVRIAPLLAAFVLVGSVGLILYSCSRSNSNPQVAANQGVQESLDTSIVASEGSDWRAKTLRLVEKAQSWDGAYTGRLDDVLGGPFDLYTTYYAVMTYKALDAAIPNANATIATLQAAQGGRWFLRSAIL